MDEIVKLKKTVDELLAKHKCSKTLMWVMLGVCVYYLFFKKEEPQ